MKDALPPCLWPPQKSRADLVREEGRARHPKVRDLAKVHYPVKATERRQAQETLSALPRGPRTPLPL